MASTLPEQDNALDSHELEFVAEMRYEEDAQTPTMIEDSEYLEIRSTERVPTKTVDEALPSDTPFEAGRPVSAGTTYSNQSELDNSDVAAVLAKNEAKPRDPSEDGGAAINATLLTRPDELRDGNVDAAFSFAKASRQHMDFASTRKGPPPNVMAVQVQPIELLTEAGNIVHADAEGMYHLPHCKSICGLTMS